MIQTLKSLHEIATDARNEAHNAYGVALRNRRADGDSEAAFQTLIKTNVVRDAIYAELLNAIGTYRGEDAS